MAEEQRHKDRKVELARQDSVIIAVANRNQQIIEGADPDPNVGTGFYPDDETEHKATDRMAAARAAKAAKAKAKGK
jgi:hypothetical protein